MIFEINGNPINLDKDSKLYLLNEYYESLIDEGYAANEAKTITEIMEFELFA